MRDDEELVVVWHGGMELLPPRSQRPDPTWTAPKRKYTRKVTTPTEKVEETKEECDDD